MDQGLSFPPLLTGATRILWSLTGANMNTTADQALAKAFSFTNYLITQIIVINASTSLTLAAGGLYTATSKGGTAVVANTQIYSALTGATPALALTIANTDQRSNAAFYLSLTTGQGGAATADFLVIGTALS